ncbi:MAG: NUDIX domain-containing protein [Salinirussus sp.]
MESTPVVTVFLRNSAEVLLLRRSSAVGSYTGRWGAVAGHAEGDPDSAARVEIAEETGIDPATETELRRRGDPFEVADDDLDTTWVVHPYLFECATRSVQLNEESSTAEWVPPPAILRRDTVPELWTSYDRVRPTLDAIAADKEHGAADLSIRALEVLRDEAAIAVERSGSDWPALIETAHSLVTARPALSVLATRVDQTMAAAIDAATPAALESAATTTITEALEADSAAAGVAADHLSDARVATLSRSGTVIQALEQADPAAVLVAESRPGGEGAAVASRLVDQLDAPVTLTTDAAFASRVHRWNADVILVGVDAIFRDGSVRNKVGTRAAALAAAHEDIPFFVVGAAAKITPDAQLPEEQRPASELTDDATVHADNPTFERTPPDLVTAVITEDGVLDAEAIAARADAHAEWRRWRP